MGGGLHEREAEFGVVPSTTKLLGAPVGAVKKVKIHSQTMIEDVAVFVSILFAFSLQTSN